MDDRGATEARCWDLKCFPIVFIENDLSFAMTDAIARVIPNQAASIQCGGIAIFRTETTIQLIMEDIVYAFVTGVKGRDRRRR